MTRADELALWDVCLHQWIRLSGRWSVIRLPREEWKDIKSEAFIHVFQKVAHYDPLKGSPEAWVGRVMQNAVFNQLRRYVPFKKVHLYRSHLRYAIPIAIEVVETGRWGELTVSVEPDVLDEIGVSPRRALEVQDFITHLPSDLRTIAMARQEGLNLTQIRRRHFRNKDYQWVARKAQQLRGWGKKLYR